MKKIISVVAATLLIAATVVSVKSYTTKNADCCTKNSACCQPGATCCKSK